jgi:hypothetical protein
MKIYIGHVALWCLFWIGIAVVKAVRKQQGFSLSLYNLFFVSCFFGLLTYLVHWGIFL